MVGGGRSGNLWLAPKLPPGADVPQEWLNFSKCVLLDTFDPSLFGGHGRTGDWPKFRRHREAHPGVKTWILSGGLNPRTWDEALAETGARFLDVNSGVESAPGIKDHARSRRSRPRCARRRAADRGRLEARGAGRFRAPPYA
jgi:phosphoribosylanthranilate isomerase